MSRIDRIGVDLGSFEYAASPACASAVAELGAKTVRVRFGLAGHLEPDSEVLQAARQAVDALRAEGLTILAVIDSDLTVAPEGMGAFSERPLGPLARAWAEEMRSNSGMLAEAIGEQVAAWEILPLPNVGAPPRIAPVRWAQLLRGTADAIRAASPGAILVAGAILSDARDDGVEYLEAAMRAMDDDAPLALDALGIHLDVMPDGGPSRETLASMLIERVRRLGEGFSNTAGEPDLIISGIGWDADTVGEEVQSRNVWTALDALTAQPEVRAVIWSALADGPPHAEGACGLFRGYGLEESDRRPAWRAFRDFATYSRQISPPMLAEDLLAEAPEPGSADSAGAEDDTKPLDFEPTTDSDAAPVLRTDFAYDDRVERVESDEGDDEHEEADVEEADVDETPSDEDATDHDDDRSEEADDDLEEEEEEEAPESDEDEVEVEPDTLDISDEDASSGWTRAGIAGAAAIAAMASEQERGALAAATESETAGESETTGEDPAESTALESRSTHSDVDADPDPHADDDPEPESESELEPDLVSEPDIALAGKPERDEAADGETADGETAAAEETDGEILHFRIPNAEEVLRDAGMEGDRLVEALEAVQKRYGSHEWLPPGEYRVQIPKTMNASSDGESPAAAEAEGLSAALAITNQNVISALYRAGGGTWQLFERAGLELRDLAARRTQAYDGPDLADLPNLSPQEQTSVDQELDALLSADAGRM